MKAVVKRTGRTWSVFNGQELIEGGFFARSAAVATADELNSVPQHGASCRCQGCSELRQEAKLAPECKHTVIGIPRETWGEEAK